MRRLTDTVTAEHQIELLAGAIAHGNKISVSCVCLRRRPWHNGRGIIDTRSLFPLADAMAAWRAWHEQEGIPL